MSKTAIYSHDNGSENHKKVMLSNIASTKCQCAAEWCHFSQTQHSRWISSSCIYTNRENK